MFFDAVFYDNKISEAYIETHTVGFAQPLADIGCVMGIAAEGQLSATKLIIKCGKVAIRKRHSYGLTQSGGIDFKGDALIYYGFQNILKLLPALMLKVYEIFLAVLIVIPCRLCYVRKHIIGVCGEHFTHLGKIQFP